MTISSPATAAKGLSLMMRGIPFAAFLPAICLLPLARDSSGFFLLYDAIEVAALLAGVGTLITMGVVREQPARGWLIAATGLFGFTFVRGLLRWLHLGFLLPLYFSPLLPYLLGFAAWLVFLQPVMEELGLVSAIGAWRTRWLVRYYAIVAAIVAVALWSGARDSDLIIGGEMSPASLVAPAAAAIAQLILLIAGFRVRRALMASAARSDGTALADPSSATQVIAVAKIAAGVIWLVVIAATVFARWPYYPRNAEDRAFGAVAVAISASFAIAAMVSGISDLLGGALGWARRLAVDSGLTLACLAGAFAVFVAGSAHDNGAPAPGDLGGLSLHRAGPDLDALLQQFYRAYQQADLQSPQPIWQLSDVAKYASAEMTASDLDQLAKDYDFRLGLRIKGIVPDDYRFALFAFGKGRQDKLRVLFYNGQVDTMTPGQLQNCMTNGPDVWPLVHFYKAYFDYEDSAGAPAHELEAVGSRAGFKQDEIAKLQDDFTWKLGQPIHKTPRDQLEQRLMAFNKRLEYPTGQGWGLFYDGTIKSLSHDTLEAYRASHPEQPAGAPGDGK